MNKLSKSIIVLILFVLLVAGLITLVYGFGGKYETVYKHRKNRKIEGTFIGIGGIVVMIASGIFIKIVLNK